MSYNYMTVKTVNGHPCFRFVDPVKEFRRRQMADAKTAAIAALSALVLVSGAIAVMAAEVLSR